jgi:hypothetical protein
MQCEICNQDRNTYYILPIPKPGGSYITIACEECAKKSSAYCQTHDQVHMGFNDGFTLCRQCINYAVEASGEKLGEEFVAQINLNQYPWDELKEYADSLSPITKESLNQIIGRTIIIAAMKARVAPQETIRQTISMSDPYLLLPPPLLF